MYEAWKKELTHDHKSLKTPVVIYADTKCLLRKYTRVITIQQIIYIKNKQTYSVWLFIIHKLFTW